MTIRDIPDDVRNELASRAARKGQSLQEFMRRVVIDCAWRPSSDEAILLAREHARTLPQISMDDILTAIHEGRR